MTTYMLHMSNSCKDINSETVLKILLKYWGIIDRTSDVSEQSWTWRHRQCLTLHRQRFCSVSAWKISTFCENASWNNHQKGIILHAWENVTFCCYQKMWRLVFCFSAFAKLLPPREVMPLAERLNSNAIIILRWLVLYLTAKLIRLETIRVILYLRLVRLGWFFRASANASAPSSPIELPHILQPIWTILISPLSPSFLYKIFL